MFVHLLSEVGDCFSSSLQEEHLAVFVWLKCAEGWTRCTKYAGVTLPSVILWTLLCSVQTWDQIDFTQSLYWQGKSHTVSEPTHSDVCILLYSSSGYSECSEMATDFSNIHYDTMV